MPSFRTRRLAATALAGLLLIAAFAPGCTYTKGDPQPVCVVNPTEVTFARVVSPIIQTECRDACHGTTNYLATGSFLNFDDFPVLQGQALNGRLMGCIRHDPGYPAMPQGEPKMSDCDIARIQAWVDQGAPNN